MKLPLAIIPASGDSTRMGEMCKDWPKWALKIDGVPILALVLAFWRRYADRLQVVVQPRYREVAFNIVHRAGMIGTARMSESVDSQGVPDTVLQGLAATGCPPQFLVALADCLWDGEFEEVDFNEHGKLFHGIAVAEPDGGDWGRSYVADLAVYDDVSGARVRSVMEKPTLALGAYWFHWTALRALEETRGRSITETLTWLLEDDYPMKPVRFRGRYLNCTTPEDLQRWH